MSANALPSVSNGPLRRLTRRLFENRNLGFLWLGQTVSIAGDSVYEKALVWLMLDLTGSSGITGLVAVSAYLPALLVGLWAGVIVDRHDRRRIMITADIARFGLVLLVPILYSLDTLSPWTLFGITFLVATGATFFNPARDAIVPSLVGNRERLLKANALIQSSWMFALLLGPAAALILLQWLGIGTSELFYFDAATFAVSAVAIGAIAARGSGIREPSSHPSMLDDLMAGLRVAGKDIRVRWLLIITAIDNLFIMGPASVGMAVFVRNTLNRSLDSLMLIEASYAVGMITGTLLLPLWRRRLNPGRILLVGMVLDGLTFVPLFWVESLPWTCFVIVVHSMAIPLLVVTRPSLVQQYVPDNLQGRVFGMIGITVVGFTAISTGLTGIVAEAVSMPVIFGVIGIAAALCGLWGLTVRPLREA